MFHLIKQVIIVLLSFSGSSTTKCVSLDNEPCIANLNPDKHNQYCVTTQLCLVYIVLMKTIILLMICPVEYKFQIKKDVNLNVFNMITWINESKILIKKYVMSF